MARMHWVGLVALSFSLVGCVSQDKFNAKKLEAEAANAALLQSQTDLAAARAESDGLKRHLASLTGSGDLNRGQLMNLMEQKAALERENADLKARYEQALRDRSTGGVVILDPNTNAALKALAAANSDVIEFDASLGLVKFKSDVTFASGSADLTPQAQSVLQRFAQILNTSASGYELMVAGHTDNARVVNPDTKRRHPNNWYLSAHRAISVAEELIAANVGQNRLGVAGYADQKPVKSNGSAEGRSANRRVEVMILPMKGGSTVASGSGNVSRPAINKDNGVPAINKDNNVPAPGLNKDSGITGAPVNPLLNK